MGTVGQAGCTPSCLYPTGCWVPELAGACGVPGELGAPWSFVLNAFPCVFMLGGQGGLSTLFLIYSHKAHQKGFAPNLMASPSFI